MKPFNTSAVVVFLFFLIKVLNLWWIRILLVNQFGRKNCVSQYTVVLSYMINNEVKFPNVICCLITDAVLFLNTAAVLVNLWRFSLTSMGEYQELLSEPTFLKDLVFAKFLILSVTITAFTSCVQHQKRYSIFCY